MKRQYNDRCLWENNRYKVITEQGITLQEFVTKNAADRYAEENGLWLGELKVEKL